MGYRKPPLSHLLEKTASLKKDFVQKARGYTPPTYQYLFEQLDKLKKDYAEAAAKSYKTNEEYVTLLIQTMALLPRPEEIEERAKAQNVDRDEYEAECRDILMGAIFDRFFRMNTGYNAWYFWDRENSVLYTKLRKILDIEKNTITDAKSLSEYFKKHPYALKEYLKAYHRFLNQAYKTEGTEFTWQALPHVRDQKAQYFFKLEGFISNAKEKINKDKTYHDIKKQIPYVHFVLSMKNSLVSCETRISEMFKQLEIQAASAGPFNDGDAMLAWAKTLVPRELMSVFEYCAERFEFEKDADNVADLVKHMRIRLNGMLSHSLLAVYIMCSEQMKKKDLKESILYKLCHHAIHSGLGLIDPESVHDALEIFATFRSKLGEVYAPVLKNTPWEKLGIKVLNDEFNNLTEEYQLLLQGKNAEEKRSSMVPS
ncbi:hypothetical protein B1207_01635 [Legionella quinlivanii]|uniref:Uncharacterized protein n=1 Tax=Legionella quinlivanii TaxID=45073 RepID=A0A364LNI2_9GAMM|nr:hypothetical protein B1207_01635 [Legionella quinlivanii]